MVAREFSPRHTNAMIVAYEKVTRRAFPALRRRRGVDLLTGPTSTAARSTTSRSLDCQDGPEGSRPVEAAATPMLRAAPRISSTASSSGTAVVSIAR